MHRALKQHISLKALEALVTIAASFLQLSYIARAYPPELVANYQLTLAWLFFVAALSCAGGISMISARDLSVCPDTERVVVFSTGFLLQIIVAALLGIGCVLLAWELPKFREIALPLSIGTVGLLGAVTLQLSQALLVSKDRIATVVSAALFAHVMATTLIVLAATFRLPLPVLIGAWATYQVINGVMLFFQANAWECIAIRTVTLRAIMDLAKEVFPVLVMIIATHLYVRIDVIMLDYFTDKETVAHYGAAYLFLDQLMILSNFMMGALFPNFARSCQELSTEYQRLYRGIVVLFAKYLLPLAGVIALSSHFLLATFFGNDYATAWPSLSVLMLAAAFAWLNGPSGTIFISLKKQHLYMWATLLSLGVNVLGNLILIPIWGGVGAAIATVLTELAICTYCLWWIRRETGYIPLTI
jgi:O-antigen/teichoic acid export membrane protein